MDSVVIMYQTKQTYCRCCGHDLQVPSVSGLKPLEVTRKRCLQWLTKDQWEFVVKDPQEFKNITEELLDEILIRTVHPDGSINIYDDEQFERLNEFITKEIVDNPEVPRERA